MEEFSTHKSNATGDPLRSKSPISIAFLFYMVTLGAIVSSCLRTLLHSEQVSGRSIGLMIFVGLAIGFVSGGLAGLFYFKSLKAACLGTLVGPVVGAIAGGLALVQNDHFAEILLVAFVGCWLMIIVMLVAARYQTELQL